MLQKTGLFWNDNGHEWKVHQTVLYRPFAPVPVCYLVIPHSEDYCRISSGTPFHFLSEVGVLHLPRSDRGQGMGCTVLDAMPDISVKSLRRLLVGLLVMELDQDSDSRHRTLVLTLRDIVSS